MNGNENYEQEIDLKDLLFHILYKWRTILVAGIVLGVLLSGYKISRDTFAPSKEEKPKKIREYELDLAEYNLNKNTYEQNIQDYEALLQHQEEYLEKSVLMQINPYEKPMASATFFVEMDEEEWQKLPENINYDVTDSVINAYCSGLRNGMDWKSMEEMFGAEELYLKELVSIREDYNGNAFTISVTHENMDLAQQMLEEVISQMEDKYQNIEDCVGKHALSVISQSINYVTDSNLANSQRENVNIMNEYQANIIDLQKSIVQLEEKEPSKPFVVGFIKYPLVGLIGGVALMAVWYGFLYLLDGRMHGERDLKERYGYPLLGAFALPVRKGWLSKVDGMLEHMAGAVQRMPEELVYQRIATNVRNLAGSAETVLVTGTVDKAMLQKTAESLSSQIPNVKFEAFSNPNTDNDTLRVLTETDAVILVEERGKSKIAEIQRIQEQISVLKKNVVGYIVL